VSLDHLFVSGMWVWLIVTLVRDVTEHVDLKKLYAASTVTAYLKRTYVAELPVTSSSSSTTIVLETQIPDEEMSPVLLPPRKRSETARLLNETVARPVKRSKASKNALNPQDKVATMVFPDSVEVEKICQIVGSNASVMQAVASMAKAQMSIEMQQFGTDMTVHMAGAYAALRQPILTRQYLGLVEFPGVATSKSLFYAHEFWYGEQHLRPYFSKFDVLLSTDRVQVVLAPLFHVHACFHLQMLQDYVMPLSGDEWLQASTEWASKCCLDSSTATHSFKIKNPHTKRVRKVQAAIKAWVDYDAQFYLGDGIFTLAPTNVFLAMNGVSPVATYSHEHAYCKMVIKKKLDNVGLPPSAMWTEFWTENAHMKCFLDETTLRTDIEGVVKEVHLPRVWAEPIPGKP
jgi:hypothetical protein